MTETRAGWSVVAPAAGVILRTFRTNAEAWRWIDRHQGEVDFALGARLRMGMVKGGGAIVCNTVASDETQQTHPRPALPGWGPVLRAVGGLPRVMTIVLRGAPPILDQGRAENRPCTSRMVRKTLPGPRGSSAATALTTTSKNGVLSAGSSGAAAANIAVISSSDSASGR